MKKIVFFLVTVVAMSASAFNLNTTNTSKIGNQVEIHTDGKIPCKSVRASEKVKQVANLTSAVINKQPEGELKTYTRAGGSYVFDGSSLALNYQTNKAYIVYGEGNKVFLKDPLYGQKNGTWVEGTLSEDSSKITVPLGQPIWIDPNNADRVLELSWGSTNYEWVEGDKNDGTISVSFTKDESVTEAIYTINGDVITLDGTEGDIDKGFPEWAVMRGLTATWRGTVNWQGCLDYGTTYTLRENVNVLPVISEQPAGELVEYVRTGKAITQQYFGLGIVEQKGNAYVVFGTDGKVYLKDPIFGAETGAWVEGTLSEDGKTISVPMGQCLGWNEWDEYGMIIKDVVVRTGDEGLSQAIYEVHGTTEMTYTIDGNKIILNGTYDDGPLEYRGLGGIWSDNMSFSGYMDWNTVYENFTLKPAVPADPLIDKDATGYAEAWNDCGNESGNSHFRHHIVLKDVDGNLIDGNYVTYSIFVDNDQLVTFDADTYTHDLTEDVTELNYTFNGFDLNPKATYFYRTNAEGYEPLFKKRIGIQVYYTVDGVRNASNIVYYNLPGYDEGGIPANPIIYDWYDSGNEDGFSMLQYKINTNTTDGKVMDPSRIYYSIFTDDDKLYTFKAENYSSLDDDMTLVPYNFFGLHLIDGLLLFYRTNADGYERFFNHQIGIQVYYQQADGSMTASDIVYLEVFPQTGIGNVKVGNATEVARYTVDGRAISAPQAGVNIIKMSDGSVKKVWVK
ncbi:MAG: hypothetical protein KBT10_09770 [Bacteroidales bacterium]|nr:hypothetical protein [Candidatus Sodaliphilus aphodohippi]